MQQPRARELESSSPPSTGLRHLFSLRAPLPPTPKPPQLAEQLPLPLPVPPVPGGRACRVGGEGKAPRGLPLGAGGPRSAAHTTSVWVTSSHRETSSKTATPASRKSSQGEGGKKRQKKERKSKTCTLGPVPLITTAKPHQGFTLLEGEKATQRCPAPEVLEVGDPHTLSSMAYGLRPRRGAFFFCSVIKSGAWSFPSIPRIALN